jgi:hypothetical protein
MKPRDCFGVVVRVIGLIIFLIGMLWVCIKSLILLESGGSTYPGMFSERGGSYFGYFYAAIFVGVGYMVMRARRIVSSNGSIRERNPDAACHCLTVSLLFPKLCRCSR